MLGELTKSLCILKLGKQNPGNVKTNIKRIVLAKSFMQFLNRLHLFKNYQL